MATVDIAALTSATKELLKDSQEDFEKSLDRVQSVIDDIDWHKMDSRLLTDEIGTVVFDGYDSLAEEIKALTFTPIAQRDLVDRDTEKSKKHVFESSSLDAAESVVVRTISAAGSGEMKNLSGSFVSSSIRNVLLQGQGKADQRDLNDYSSLVERYNTPNTAGNSAWISLQASRKTEDRERNVYSALFSLSQQNIEFAFKQGIAIEQIHEDFTARYNRLFLDITAANIAAYNAEITANIYDFEAQIASLDAQMKVEELKFQKDSAEYELLIDQANARLQQYISQYSAKVSTNVNLMSMRLAGGKNIADGYKSILSAYSSQYSAVSLSNSGDEG